jgi:multidrug efflux system membrane fusion protein
VLALDNVIDQTTGTVRLRSQFTNDDNTLFPGQFVNVRLLVDTLKGKTLIPTAAIQRNAQAEFVYIVKSDQTVEMRNIQTDITDGDTTAIEGVQPGETLVTDNFNRIQDKAKVAPRKPEEAGGKAGSRGRRGGDTNANAATNGGDGRQ